MKLRVHFLYQQFETGYFSWCTMRGAAGTAARRPDAALNSILNAKRSKEEVEVSAGSESVVDWGTFGDSIMTLVCETAPPYVDVNVLCVCRTIGLLMLQQ
jgi:hypothetical protein